MTATATATPTGADVGSKGLAAGRLGLFSSTVIGVGSTAPLYSLAATLGYIVIGAGAQAPIAIILAFVPMWLTAYAYAELNRAVPDAGTAFTWAAKAFGPRTGWFAGWGVFVAGVIVMSSQTEVASRYLLMLVGDGGLAESKTAVTAFGVLIMAVMTWVTVRAVEAGVLTQYVLMAVQFTAIGLFAVDSASPWPSTGRPSPSPGSGSTRSPRTTRSDSCRPSSSASSSTGAGTPASPWRRRPRTRAAPRAWPR